MTFGQLSFDTKPIENYKPYPYLREKPYLC